MLIPAEVHDVAVYVADAGGFMNSSDRRTKLKTEDYKAVLDNIDDGIFVVDTKGIILEVNKAVEKNGGKKMDELIGRNIDDLVKEGYCSEFVSSRVLMSGREEVLVQKTGDIQGYQRLRMYFVRPLYHRRTSCDTFYTGYLGRYPQHQRGGVQRIPAARHITAT